MEIISGDAAYRITEEFRQDASSGISFVGRGSAKVYVKK